MRLNLYASLEHYAEHLWPIWQALPERLRGAAWSTQHGRWWGNAQMGAGDAVAHPGPLLVASHGDAVSVAARGRELVYVEHGAGQTYGGDPAGAGAAGLSGSTDRAMRRVVLFVCPNETVAQRWRELYQVPAIAVGCPKLDDWHANEGRKRPTLAELTVAVTFHWDSSLVPETMTAWPEYDPVLPELARWCAANEVKLLGHGHPRMWPRLERRWNELGVTPVQHLSDVFDHADVLVADNTSAMYEFASIGRPVVVLNSMHYRRHVEHGLRFWSHVPGVQVDDPAELVGEWGTVATTVAALRQGVLLGDESRQAAVLAAYAHTDGRAAERAADAIVRMLEP